MYILLALLLLYFLDWPMILKNYKLTLYVQLSFDSYFFNKLYKM